MGRTRPEQAEQSELSKILELARGHGPSISVLLVSGVVGLYVGAMIAYGTADTWYRPDVGAVPGTEAERLGADDEFGVWQALVVGEVGLWGFVCPFMIRSVWVLWDASRPQKLKGRQWGSIGAMSTVAVVFGVISATGFSSVDAFLDTGLAVRSVALLLVGLVSVAGPAALALGLVSVRANQLRVRPAAQSADRGSDEEPVRSDVDEVRELAALRELNGRLLALISTLGVVAIFGAGAYRHFTVAAAEASPEPLVALPVSAIYLYALLITVVIAVPYLTAEAALRHAVGSHADARSFGPDVEVFEGLRRSRDLSVDVFGSRSTARTIGLLTMVVAPLISGAVALFLTAD